MKELGILVLNPEQEKDYFNQLGVHAKQFDFTLYLFTPESFSPTAHTIYGKKFISENNWLGGTFTLPTFIYDRCFYPSTNYRNYFATKIQALKRMATFIGHGLPGKLAVYQALIKEPALRNYLPETEELKSPRQLQYFIDRFHNVIIKPIEGSQGKGIVKLNEKSLNLDPDKFAGFYLIQPYLSLEIDNRPHDIRILLQRDNDGQWMEQGRGVRVGKPEALISNLHAGGHVVDYTDWINKYFADKKQQINQSISEITERLPTILDKNFPRLFEIGLDIGLDQRGQVWILEVNSKPGHQVLDFFQNHKMYEAPFLYCFHLLTKKEGIEYGKNLSH